jgi:transcriptional regulator NrdR family protein
MGKLCSKTRARGIYSTHRTATERENLGIWARDSLATRKSALRRRECERCGARYGLYARVVMSVDT